MKLVMSEFMNGMVSWVQLGNDIDGDAPLIILDREYL